MMTMMMTPMMMMMMVMMMMMMTCIDVHFNGDDDDFHTVWHLTRSQYGHQWLWIVSGVENKHFFALHVQILASNLDWKQVRGSAMKICCCWNLDDAIETMYHVLFQW